MLLNPAKESDSVLYCMVSLSITTGVRKGELLALRWQDSDFINETLHVQRSYRKMELTRFPGHHATIVAKGVRDARIPTELSSGVQERAG